MGVELSIIIPVYNAENTIIKCVQSTLCRQLDLIEVILVDDGSTDQTGDKCRILQKKYDFVKYYRVNNGGVSRARNIGIEKSEGQWLMFIDSDDYLEEGTVDLCLSMLQSKTEIVYFGMIRDYVKQGKCIKSINNEISIFKNRNQNLISLSIEEDFLRLFDNEFFDSACGKIFKSSIIKHNRIYFDENMKCREDTVFVLNYCQYVRIVDLLNHYGYHYQNENDKTYQFKRNIEAWEIEKLYQAYYSIISHITNQTNFLDRKICNFIFQVLLCGIIHNSAKQYAGGFFKLKKYLTECMSNMCVYSCIMKSESKSKFLNLLIHLLQKKRVTIVSMICIRRFENI